MSNLHNEQQIADMRKAGRRVSEDAYYQVIEGLIGAVNATDLRALHRLGCAPMHLDAPSFSGSDSSQPSTSRSQTSSMNQPGIIE